MIERSVARVVLCDQHGAVLLLSARDAARPAATQFWLTPGGGLEDGESLEDAAHREVFEETGMSLGEVGPVVWESDAAFRFEEREYLQHESFFVVEVERFEVCPTSLTDVEARTTTGWRWWSPAELAGATEPIYPSALASLILARRQGCVTQVPPLRCTQGSR